mgnify:CR=1 FL=1
MMTVRNRDIKFVGKLEVGDKVEHILLGQGIVTKFKEKKGDTEVTVDFKNAGEIILLMSRAATKIKKI